jgi:predicted RNA-binding protein YlxR (DUF448 family)
MLAMPRLNSSPQRTCVGCQQRDSKHHMLRFVGETAGLITAGLIIDEAGRMPGRGGYLHWREECISSFARSKAPEVRSLRRRISREQRLNFAELIRTRLDSRAALE